VKSRKVQIAICIPRSAKGGSVPADPTTRSIDQLFDFIDKGVDAVDRVVNRSKYADEQLQEQAQEHDRRRKRRKIIDTVPEKVVKKESSPSAVLVRKPHFYISEAVDPKSGQTIYVVTDGRHARTECATREFATQILRALEKAP
jgi:hypothetical protein